MIVLASAAPTLAQSSGVRDADVDELIEHLVTILKDRQNVYASIRLTGPIRIVATGETVEITDETYRGTLVSKNAHKIVFKTIDGRTGKLRTGEDHSGRCYILLDQRAFRLDRDGSHVDSSGTEFKISRRG